MVLVLIDILTDDLLDLDIIIISVVTNIK